MIAGDLAERVIIIDGWLAELNTGAAQAKHGRNALHDVPLVG